MAALVRVQAVRGYRELVAELGGDPVRLLRAAKVKSTAFDQPASFISFGAIVQLLERSARDLACPDFGLRLAERQDIGILGPLAVAMRYSATVGEAMSCASKYIYVYNAAIGFSVQADQGDDQALFAFEILSEHGPHCAQMIEHGVGITSRILSMLSAGRSHPNRVWLPHPAVASGPATVATWVRRWSSRPRWRRWRSIGAISTCRWANTMRSCAEFDVEDVAGVVTGHGQPMSDTWGEVGVDQDLHADIGEGNSRRSPRRLRTRAQPGRLGVLGRGVASTSSIVRPAASWPMTALTVTRIPRIHGRPPIWCGLAVIRSKASALEA